MAQRAQAGLPVGPTGSSTPSITDSLPASALAVVVANASGNANAGMAVVQEEYNRSWQQYYGQWGQYAAWGQYSQQQQAAAAGGQPDQGEYSQPPPVAPPLPPTEAAMGPQGGQDMFEGDELELIGNLTLSHL